MQNEARKFLFVISHRVGDAIFCLPSIRFVREKFAESRIGVLTLSKLSAQVFENVSFIDELFVLPKKRTVKQLKNTYEIAVNYHHGKLDHKYMRWLDMPSYDLIQDSSKHYIEDNFKFTHDIFCPKENFEENYNPDYEVFFTKKNAEEAKEILLANGAMLNSDEILIGCHLGCHRISSRLNNIFRRKLTHNRVWPLENFKKLQQMLYEHNNKIKLVMTGSKSEQKMLQKMDLRLGNIINLMGKTTVPQLASFSAHLNAFVTCDTGPMHVLSCTDLPIIALFLTEKIIRSQPFPPRKSHVIIHKNMINDISVAEVYYSLLQYLNKEKNHNECS